MILSVGLIPCTPQIISVDWSQIQKANDKARAYDSCAAAGVILQTTAKDLDNKNKSLTDTLKKSKEKIGKLEGKLSKGTKIAVGSIIVNIILTLVLVL